MSVWASTTLGDVIAKSDGSIKTGPFGTMLKASEYSANGVPVISVGEVAAGELKLRTDTPRVDKNVTTRLPEYLLRTGDIVFGRKGAVDRSAWVRPHQDGWFLGSDGIRLRLPETVDSEFIGYQLQLSSTRDWLLQHASGSTMLSLNQGTLGRVPIVLPPRPEQRAIAEVLGSLDDKIAVNARLSGTSMELAGHLFDSFVAQLPRQRMSEALLPVLGGTPARADEALWGGTNLWASAKDITSAQFGVVLDTLEKISDHAVVTTKAKPLPRGSVILTARGTVGAVGRLGKPSSFNQSCYGFAPGPLSQGVLYFSVLRATERAKAIAHGSVFDTITMRTFDHLEVPQLSEAAMADLEHQVGPLLAAVEQAGEESRLLASTREALLPQLMSGRIRVRDVEQMVGDVV